MSINRIRKLNDEINSLFRFDDGEFMANGNSNNDLLGSGYSRGLAMRSNSYNDSGKLGYEYSKDRNYSLNTTQNNTDNSCELCL